MIMPQIRQLLRGSQQIQALTTAVDDISGVMKSVDRSYIQQIEGCEEAYSH